VSGIQFATLATGQQLRQEMFALVLNLSESNSDYTHCKRITLYSVFSLESRDM
jgi:hypothetical protein